MTATTPQAWPLAKHLALLLAPSLDPADVHPCWPGDKTPTPEMVWIENLRSDTTVPVSRAGRQVRDEAITADIRIVVKARPSIDTAMTRVSELVTAVEGLIADDPSLGGFDGVWLTTTAGYQIDLNVTPDGVFATGSVAISVRFRLR